MKLLLIAPINSIHVIRWANALVKYNIDLHIATMHNAVEKLDRRIVIHKLPYKSPLGYVTNFWILRKTIKDLKPDLIHTHQLTGHATLTALAYRGIKIPYLLSMYGSDIYDFPTRSYIHRKLIYWTSKKATQLASTSKAMKNMFYTVVNNYEKDILITPFGVDTNKFSPQVRKSNDRVFRIGIAKRIEDKYGIKYLIDAFSIFQKKHQTSELHIIGRGTKLEELKQQVKKLRISNNVEFHGRVDNSLLPLHINNWNVCVIPSILESFGVSAVEALSCSIPVIASNVGGLPEVINNGECGFVVEKESSNQILEKLELLYNNPLLLKKLGNAGRQRVLDNYDWDKNVELMVSIYDNLINNK